MIKRFYSLTVKVADGTKIQTQGQSILGFEIEGYQFHQNLIVAKLAGIQDIIGMDLLNKYEAVINVTKKIMKTSSGKIRWYKQSTNACARIQISERMIIPPNSEKFVEGVIDLPCIQNKSLGMVETSSFMEEKGCLLARSLIDSEKEKAVVAIVNLSDQSVKINENSTLGNLQPVDQVHTNSNQSTSNTTLPSHLNSLVDKASAKLTNSEQTSLSNLLTDYQDIFVGPDGLFRQQTLLNMKLTF